METTTTTMTMMSFYPDVDEELIQADFSHSLEVSEVADLAEVPVAVLAAAVSADSVAAEVSAAAVLPEDGRFCVGELESG